MSARLGFPAAEPSPALPNPHSSNPGAATSSNPGMPPPPPTLMEELIEEILLRFPPEEPASLFRASLVCKPWCRLISCPRFRRRYREFHRTPPMLGFLCSRHLMHPTDTFEIPRFVPTSASCRPLAERRRCHLVDARHGRVLLVKPRRLVVWDPITDEHREVPMPELPPSTRSWNAAVVCAASAGTCDHLDCHRGPFLVVFVVSCPAEMLIWTYSSDTGSWSDPILSLQDQYVSLYCPSMLVGNALYFEVQNRLRILKYDLGSQETSVVGLPPTSFLVQPCYRHPFVLTTPEDGRLGVATIHESKLYMWSTKHGPEADAAWTCDSVIELETLLCSNAILTKPVLVGFVDRIGVGFLRADDFLFTIDLNTRKVKKVYEGRGIYTVVPYMSFCTPALGGGLRGEGPSAGVSSS